MNPNQIDPRSGRIGDGTQTGYGPYGSGPGTGRSGGPAAPAMTHGPYTHGDVNNGAPNDNLNPCANIVLSSFDGACSGMIRGCA